MYGNYLVLCGMAWSQFGAQEAGLELIRALSSSDPDVRVLARTLLEQANGGSKELIGEALSQDEISASMANLCGFEKDREPRVQSLGGSAWLPWASA